MAPIAVLHAEPMEIERTPCADSDHDGPQPLNSCIEQQIDQRLSLFIHLLNEIEEHDHMADNDAAQADDELGVIQLLNLRRHGEPKPGHPPPTKKVIDLRICCGFPPFPCRKGLLKFL
jgi:hypothetical protein